MHKWLVPRFYDSRCVPCTTTGRFFYYIYKHFIRRQKIVYQNDANLITEQISFYYGVEKILSCMPPIAPQGARICLPAMSCIGHYRKKWSLRSSIMQRGAFAASAILYMMRVGNAKSAAIFIVTRDNSRSQSRDVAR